MASDLDRAYVINGDDMRCALGGSSWAFRARGHAGGGDYVGELTLPDDVARVVLEKHGRLLEDARPGVTVAQLAGALEGFGVDVRTATGTAVGAMLADPGETARVLHATLSRQAALREDEPEAREDERQAQTPREEPGFKCGAPECAQCYPEEALRDDPEVNAIRAVTGLLQGLDSRSARLRVLDYLTARFADGDMPPGGHRQEEARDA